MRPASAPLDPSAAAAAPAAFAIRVTAPDRPGLLCDLASALSAAGLAIVRGVVSGAAVAGGPEGGGGGGGVGGSPGPPPGCALAVFQVRSARPGGALPDPASLEALLSAAAGAWSSGGGGPAAPPGLPHYHPPSGSAGGGDPSVRGGTAFGEEAGGGGADSPRVKRSRGP